MKKILFFVLMLGMSVSIGLAQTTGKKDTTFNEWNPHGIKIPDSLAVYYEQVRDALGSIGDTFPISAPTNAKFKEFKNFYTITLVREYADGGIVCDGVAMYKIAPYKKEEDIFIFPAFASFFVLILSIILIIYIRKKYP